MGIDARGCGSRRLQRPACLARQVDRKDVREVARQELVLPPKVAWSGLRCRGVMRIRIEFGKELIPQIREQVAAIDAGNRTAAESG